MNNARMDPRRLELLLELSRLGSMRAVAETMHITTSTVSQQLAVLARAEVAALMSYFGRLGTRLVVRQVDDEQAAAKEAGGPDNITAIIVRAR